MVPLLYTTLCKSPRPLSMVDPIRAFLLTEQQLFPLSRLVACSGFFVLGLFVGFFFSNCDQDLGLARSLCVGRSAHPYSSHEV